jgi:hypothetical protein
VDVIVAGGADEDSRGDAAACVALGAAAPSGRPAPVMVGWGLAGRGAVKRASAAALDMAGLGPSDIRAILGPGDPARLFPSMGWQGSMPHLDPSRTMGWAEASSGVLALAAALPDVRDGGGPVLVYSGESASMSAALVVTGGCGAA